jgi:hypothetical protein
MLDIVCDGRLMILMSRWAKTSRMSNVDWDATHAFRDTLVHSRAISVLGSLHECMVKSVSCTGRHDRCAVVARVLAVYCRAERVK